MVQENEIPIPTDNSDTGPFTSNVTATANEYERRIAELERALAERDRRIAFLERTADYADSALDLARKEIDTLALAFTGKRPPDRSA